MKKEIHARRDKKEDAHGSGETKRETKSYEIYRYELFPGVKSTYVAKSLRHSDPFFLHSVPSDEEEK